MAFEVLFMSSKHIQSCHIWHLAPILYIRKSARQVADGFWEPPILIKYDNRSYLQWTLFFLISDCNFHNDLPFYLTNKVSEAYYKRIIWTRDLHCLLMGLWDSCSIPTDNHNSHQVATGRCQVDLKLLTWLISASDYLKYIIFPVLRHWPYNIDAA